MHLKIYQTGINVLWKYVVSLLTLSTSTRIVRVLLSSRIYSFTVPLPTPFEHAPTRRHHLTQKPSHSHLVPSGPEPCQRCETFAAGAPVHTHTHTRVAVRFLNTFNERDVIVHVIHSKFPFICLLCAYE